jgi:hypothetical protein
MGQNHRKGGFGLMPQGALHTSDLPQWGTRGLGYFPLLTPAFEDIQVQVLPVLGGCRQELFWPPGTVLQQREAGAGSGEGPGRGPTGPWSKQARAGWGPGLPLGGPPQVYLCESEFPSEKKALLKKM